MAERVIPRDIKIPPSEIKETIDKTVGYILKNGSLFEDRLKKNEGSNEKFSFLKENDTYNPYYQWKVGKTTDLHVSNGDGGSAIAGPQEPIQKPRELDFIASNPPISPLDLDIIKLTALFVARNGTKYIEHLIAHQIKQSNKAQFEFLNEKHSLHPVFKQYIKQYEMVLHLFSEDSGDEVKGIIERLSHPEDIFQVAYRRAHYDKQHKAEVKNEKLLEEKKKLAYASIDWQDFAIVGKIEFDAVDEVRELAVPLRREDLIYRSLEARQKEIELAKAEAQPKDEPEVPDPGPKDNNVVKHSMPKGMKIRAAGESRLKTKSSKEVSNYKEGHIKCPITGKFIPELQFDNHLKVLLRDPRYKEQQDNFVRKNFTYSSNLTTDEVYDNIKRLARKRDGNQDAEASVTKKPALIGPQ